MDDLTFIQHRFLQGSNNIYPGMADILNGCNSVPGRNAEPAVEPAVVAGKTKTGSGKGADHSLAGTAMFGKVYAVSGRRFVCLQFGDDGCLSPMA